MLIFIAALLGGAHRRWLGSERPAWMKPIDGWWRDYFGIVRPDKGAPYRAAQIVLGVIALGLLCWANGDPWWRAPLDTAAAFGIMTVSAHTRDPFIWLMEKISPPKLWGDFLNGPEPWSEALQGACLWALAVAL